MTIDEAIQRENKIAKENQKIVDTEIVFDGVSLSQLYCDDTEVIEEHLENYKKCAENQYNKAIDDFVKFANTMPTVEVDGEIRPMWLEEMAEQLKAGGNIEL